MVERLRGRLRRRRGAADGHIAAQHGLGAAPSPPRADADDAELDALRGELVRELDKLASDGAGSACLRRI